MTKKKTSEVVAELYKELEHVNFIYSANAPRIREAGLTFVSRANAKIQPKLFDALLCWMKDRAPGSPVTLELEEKGFQILQERR